MPRRPRAGRPERRTGCGRDDRRLVRPVADRRRPRAGHRDHRHRPGTPRGPRRGARPGYRGAPGGRRLERPRRRLLRCRLLLRRHVRRLRLPRRSTGVAGSAHRRRHHRTGDGPMSAPTRHRLAAYVPPHLELTDVAHAAAWLPDALTAGPVNVAEELVREHIAAVTAFSVALERGEAVVDGLQPGRPWWQGEPCPPWCQFEPAGQAHPADSAPDDRVHTSAEADVTL